MPKHRERNQKPVQNEPPLFCGPRDLFQHEIQTLARIATISSWPQILSQWRQEIVTASTMAKNSGKLSIHLRFAADDPRAKANEPRHLVELGALIDPGNTLISYCWVIGKAGMNGQCEGLRKLHFDVEPMASSNEPKPVFHMQFPGRVWPALNAVGYSPNAFEFLNPKLDKPRIPSLPTSLSILAHTALLEYVSTDSRIATFVCSSEWLAAVKSSEEYILKTFLDHSLTWLNKVTNRKKSLISHFYRYSAS
jgi:hypothetical protein